MAIDLLRMPIIAGGGIMTIKSVKQKYKFYHIFVNGVELYHKDNSIDDMRIKSLKEKDYFFGSKAIYVTI